MTNLKQLKDFLGQHGLEVDIVDLSQPHIHVDDKSGSIKQIYKKYLLI